MPFATKEARNEYQRKWVARRRAEFFTDKACVKCGATEDLQLDHIDPSSKTHHCIWSWSAARREAEIAKCQILCPPCHRKKTKEYRDNLRARGIDPNEHGLAKYWRDGCRCKICRAASAAYKRERRAKHP